MGADNSITGTTQQRHVNTTNADALGAAWVSAPLDRLHISAHAGVAIDQPATDGETVWEVPTVELSLSDAAAAAQLYSAAASVGFFYVSGHDVSEECLRRQFQQSKEFFALPLADKLRVRADTSNRGYHPFGIGTAKNPYQQLDRKEAWNGYLGWEDDAVDTPFRGRNRWPNEELLPGFRPAMTAYYHAMNGVAERLLRLIAIGLQLPDDFFDPYFDAAISNIRTIRYLPGQHRAQDGVFGVGAHTDWGMLTVLATDTVPGLQIFHAGAWRDVPPRPGCFVVNVGDLLHRWTGGRFLSTLHRVEKRTPEERYSAPFFCAPNLDAIIEVLEPCAVADSEDEGLQPSPSRLEPITCGQWLMKRRAAEYGAKPQLMVA